MKKTCSAYRDDLPGYRLGEGTPLERERMKAHLEGCADCRAHLAAYEMLVRDAREEPPALAIEDKDRIWKKIESELPGTQPSLLDSIQRLFQPRWQPAIGMAAACLTYLVLVNPPPQDEVPVSNSVEQPLAQRTKTVEHTPKPLKIVVAELAQPDSHEALEVAPGVNARTTKRAKVRKTGTAHAPRVELTKGDLLAEYTRQAKQEPMVVQTPHFEAVIRGTIFVISVEAESSSLTVAEGKVEARHKGMSVMVNAGQSLRISGSKSPGAEASQSEQPAAEAEDVIDAMKRLFPEHEAKPIKPALEQPTAAPKTTKKAALPAEPFMAPNERLTNARNAWLNGKLDEAKDEVTRLLRHPDLQPKLQDDARLLRASILRARGELAEAMVDLEVVAAVGREASRLAAFELGRLAREEGRLVTAKRALKQVIEANDTDVLSEEARFELCQLLTEEGSGDESVACWEALQDASDPSLRDKAQRALDSK